MRDRAGRAGQSQSVSGKRNAGVRWRRLLKSPEAARAARRPAPIISHVPDGVEGYLLPRGGREMADARGISRARRLPGGSPRRARWRPRTSPTLVKDSNLRGRGGAGFVTGLKWTFMPPRDARPRYLAVNADESEPGTFKDRQIMSRNPYPADGGNHDRRDGDGVHRRLHLHPRRICRGIRGDERGDPLALRSRKFSATTRSASTAASTSPSSTARARTSAARRAGCSNRWKGNKGQPRKRPPFPAQCGIVGPADHGRQCRDLLARAGDRDARRAMVPEKGSSNSAGHTLFGVSGHVNNPGIFEMPLGVKLRDLIYKYAGGLDRRPADQGDHSGRRLDAGAARRPDRRRDGSRIAARGRHAARHRRARS